MESWSHASEGKGFSISEEIDLSADTVARTRKIPTIWGVKSPCCFRSGMLVPNREVGESMEFMEVASCEMMRKSASNNPSLGIFGGQNCNDSSKRVPSASCMTTSSSFLGELEFSSSLSCSVIESDSQKLPLIDLKLGGLADCRDVNNSRFSKEMSVLSSTGSSNPVKRARTSNLYPQTPICQVYGCNKDLSSSKEYHKRHKVCDAHSKTAKVIVDGIEQRFCQQCSRFHLLTEFDDEKRSCRKRLAGHNERRRKLQLDSRTANPQKWLQYQGTRFLETSLPKRASFFFSDVLNDGAFNQEGYNHDTQCGHIKLETEQIYNPQLVMPITKAQSLPKSFLHLHGMERQYPSGTFSSEINYSGLDTASTVREVSGVTKSSCAHSLLSAQSQNLSSLSTGIPTAYPLIQGTHDHPGVDKKFDKLLDVSILDKFAPRGFHLSGMNLMKVDQLAHSMISDTNNSLDPEVHVSVSCQRSDSLNPKCWLSPENGSTVNLLQLSSHLQRMEQQRNSVQVKQENDIFYCFPTT